MTTVEHLLVGSYDWARNYARSCAASFADSYDVDELVSAGIAGYVMAAMRYDYNRGSSFRSYCAMRIRGAIMDELRKSTWEPRSVRRNQQIITHQQMALEARLQRRPTSSELAEALNISEEDLVHLQKLSTPARCLSLDDERGGRTEDESLPLKEMIPDTTVMLPGAVASSKDTRRILCSCISKLCPSEATVIVLHYLRNLSFHEIADKMKLTPSRISQLHHHGLTLLKKALKRHEDELGVVARSLGSN